MARQEPIRKRSGPPPPPPPPREIPDKLYFRIGEVARLCEVPAYVLRFWESEFPQLKPNKGGTGQRLYRRKDVEMALRVKTLLYDEGYTIAGARQAFKTELRTGKEAATAADGASEQPNGQLEAIRTELRDLLALLLKPPAARAAVQSIRAPRPVPEPRVLKPPVPFPGPKRPEASRPGLFDHQNDEPA